MHITCDVLSSLVDRVVYCVVILGRGMARVITIWTSVPGTLQAGKQWLLERFVWFELCHVTLDERRLFFGSKRPRNQDQPGPGLHSTMARTELVDDMKLHAEVHHDGSTSHYAFHPGGTQGSTSRRIKREVWKRGEILGSGGFGVVWVERSLSSQGSARL